MRYPAVLLLLSLIAAACTDPSSRTALTPTAPSGPDSDGDGFTDADEILAGSNPNSADSIPDEPSITIDQAPAALNNQTSVEVAFTVRSVFETTVECSFDGDTPATCQSSYSVDGVGEGEHEIEVVVTDTYGRVVAESATWRADQTPPLVTWTAAPAAATNSGEVKLAWTSEPMASFKCSYNAAAFTNCTSPVYVTDGTEKTHVFLLRASDTLGNVVDVSAVWTVDRTDPETYIAQAPPWPVTYETTLNFEFASDSTPSTFSCSFDSVNWGPCDAVASFTTTTPAIYRLEVRAQDEAGNVDPSPEYFEWKITSPQAMYRYGYGITASSGSIGVRDLTAHGNGYVLAGHYAADLFLDPLNPNAASLKPVSAASLAPDGFLARYRADGSLDWARRVGGSDHDVTWAVAVTDGVTFAGGEFSGAVTFSEAAGEVTSTGRSDAWLAAYDASGNFDWVKTWGSTEYDRVLDIAVDDDGSLFVAGTFEFSVTIDASTPYAKTITSSDWADGYIAKFSPAGDLQWVQVIAGQQDQTVRAIGLDSSGNLVVVGESMDDVVFRPGYSDAVTLVADAAEQSWAAKFSAQGDLTWAAKLPVRPVALAVDNKDRIAVAGQFDATVTFGNGEPGEITVTPKALSDGYLAVYSPGGAFEWVQCMKGSSNEAALNVVSLANGNGFAVSGHLSNYTVLDDGGPSEQEVRTIAPRDAFVAGYANEDGRLLFVTHGGGAAGRTIAQAASGRLILGGEADSEVLTFGKGEPGEESFTSAPNNGFVVHFGAE